MALTLGLESIAVEKDVTPLDLLKAKFTLLQAQHEYELAVTEETIMEQNVHNYNEIIAQLKKHSSAECLAFARDLIGSDISVESEAMPENQEIKKKSQGKLKNLLDAIVNFINKCTKWIRRQVAKLMASLTSIKDAAMTQSVSFSIELLNEITDVCGFNGIYTSKNTEKMKALLGKISSKNKVTIELGKDGAAWLDAASKAQTTLQAFAKKILVLFKNPPENRYTAQHDFERIFDDLQSLCIKIEQPLMKDIARINNYVVKLNRYNKYKKEAEG